MPGKCHAGVWAQRYNVTSNRSGSGSRFYCRGGSSFDIAVDKSLLALEVQLALETRRGPRNGAGGCISPTLCPAPNVTLDTRSSSERLLERMKSKIREPRHTAT